MACCWRSLSQPERQAATNEMGLNDMDISESYCCPWPAPVPYFQRVRISTPYAFEFLDCTRIPDPKARSYNGIVGEHIVVACTRRQLLCEHEFARNRPYYIKASEVLSQRSG